MPPQNKEWFELTRELREYDGPAVSSGEHVFIEQLDEKGENYMPTDREHAVLHRIYDAAFNSEQTPDDR